MSPVSRAVAEQLKNASWIRRMFEAGAMLKQQHGEDAVCDFSLGNPDLPPPAEVGKGLMNIYAKIGEPFAFGYMPNAGFPWAREQLAAYLSIEQQVPLTGSDVVLTCGAAGALNVIFKTVLDPGDEVIAIAPYFVEYGGYVNNHGGVLRAVPSTVDTFNLDLEAIEVAINHRTRAIIINSPNNPTGQVYTEDELKALISLLARKNKENGRAIYLVADEPYRFLTYDGTVVPATLPLYPFAILASSFSKNLSLPGERMGYIAVSPLLEKRADLVAGFILANRILGFVNPPVVGQYLMAAALGSQVDASIYGARRKAMAEVLTRAGYDFFMPRGAFYFFPKAPGGDDVAFVKRLQEELVLAVPGSGFVGSGHFRLTFCVDEAVIRRAEVGLKRARDAYR